MNSMPGCGDLVLTRRGLRFGGRSIPCTFGKGGIRIDKREGDGATPVGAHRIVDMLYRPDRLTSPNTWATPIRPGDLWSDASGEPDYNRLVRAPYPHSHERMRRADPLYDIVLVTDWKLAHSRPWQGIGHFHASVAAAWLSHRRLRCRCTR